MPPQKRTTDKYLSNGSVICWSRRQDPYVPVICGQCQRERVVLSNNTTRKKYDGICRECTHGVSWQDAVLDNQSIVFWSKRSGQKVPVQCGKCNIEHTTYASNIYKSTFTGLCRKCLHTGPSSTTWRGGRVDKNGYIYVKVYPDHQFYKAMANQIGYIAEHRLAMAEHLGRPLKSTEVVHHKNGNKHDNQIENLELFVSFHEHGKALQARRPHPGFESADAIRQAIKHLKKLLGEED